MTDTKETRTLRIVRKGEGTGVDESGYRDEEAGYIDNGEFEEVHHPGGWRPDEPLKCLWCGMQTKPGRDFCWEACARKFFEHARHLIPIPEPGWLRTEREMIERFQERRKVASADNTCQIPDCAVEVKSPRKTCSNAHRSLAYRMRSQGQL